MDDFIRILSEKKIKCKNNGGMEISFNDAVAQFWPGMSDH